MGLPRRVRDSRAYLSSFLGGGTRALLRCTPGQAIATNYPRNRGVVGPDALRLRETIRGIDQRRGDERFVESVTGIRHHHELGFRPRAVKVPCGDGRGTGVIALLHDYSRDVGKRAGFADELAVVEEPAINEIVVLNSGENERVMRISEGSRNIRLRQQSGNERLPNRSRNHGGAVNSGVVIRE